MIPERYTFKNVKRAVNNPELAHREIRKIIYKFPFMIHRLETKPVRMSGYGTNVMDKDWDNLIILDACRYDIFKEVNNIEEYTTLNTIESVGSHSEEFINKTFSQSQFLDTVYVTANGFGASLSSDTFHDLIFTNVDESNDSSHPRWEGIAPDTVAQAAIKAKNKYPNKKLITHFMQPHNPYFGEKADELRQGLKNKGVLVTQKKERYEEKELGKKYDVYPTLMHAARDGLVSPQDMKYMYKENLEIVLEHVKNLIGELEGEIVITADHGELLCENAGLAKYASHKRITPSGDFIGHASNMYVRELREVPWMTVRRGPRPNIIAETPEEANSVSDDEIEERLRVLGYKE